MNRIQSAVMKSSYRAMHSPSPTHLGNWSKVSWVCLFTIGLIGAQAVAPQHKRIVFAGGEDHPSHLKEVMEEIVQHAIWHHIGQGLSLGSFATGILGGLLFVQTLGGREEFYIPRRLPPPMITKCINPRTGKLDDCLVINGQQLMGQAILRFGQELQAVQLLKSLERGRRV